eukprot:9629332-Alexandrium_andersonii.AAC.1
MSDRKALRSLGGMPRPSRTRRSQSQFRRSKAFLWSANTAAGHSSTLEAGSCSMRWRARGARSPSTCPQRSDDKSTRAGGDAPESRWAMISARFDPPVPPRIAAWQSDKMPSRARPEACTRGAQNSLRRQVDLERGK